jgi:hypothetical protein
MGMSIEQLQVMWLAGFTVFEAQRLINKPTEIYGLVTVSRLFEKWERAASTQHLTV